ncbi:MAG: DUF1835 domain-containing protein [Bacteroidetes bacterium]|nr:DUF1835 domain-containing protein [Bacteroidota bacterium]
MLHITNGDSAADLIRSANIGGDVLPWRDVLHIGPVPGRITANMLNEKRAKYLASLGWGKESELLQSFLLRDSKLKSNLGESSIFLWFEHDLYDQLQLIQILDRLVESDSEIREVFLICIDHYPGVDPFHGLGNLNQEQLTHLFSGHKPVTSDQLSSAVHAWECFTSSDPIQHQKLAATANSDLPFFQMAYRRFLEEWPSAHNGLSRTEAHALSLITEGMGDPVELFHAHQANEEAPFMGDWTFWETLRSLARGTAPLIIVEGEHGHENFQNVRLHITPKGMAVLQGTEDAIRLRGINRWYGGYHAVHSDCTPRWDTTRGNLTAL